MISTAAAILGAAAIGGVGTAVASSNAANAAKKAGQLQANADQAAIDLQRQIYEQNRADNAWQRNLGMSAGSALAANFGLSTPAGVSMTGGANGSGSVSTAKTSGGFAGTSPLEAASQNGVSMTGSNTIPDWSAYLANNPDVAAEAARVVANDPKAIGDQNGDGRTDATDYAIYHAATFHDRPVPTTAVPSTTNANGQQAGYFDPTASGGYTSPVRMTMPALDVSTAAYHTSPGYQWQLEQGQTALDHVASAGGGLMSGARQKAALRFSQGLADQDYTDWRNYTTGQYNADRNFNEATYEADRSRLDSRYDTRNNQLLALSGFGQAATAANQSAAQSFANNASNLMTQGAAAQGNAAIGAANAWSSGLNNIMTLGAYGLGQVYGGSKTPTSLPSSSWI